MQSMFYANCIGKWGHQWVNGENKPNFQYIEGSCIQKASNSTEHWVKKTCPWATIYRKLYLLLAQPELEPEDKAKRFPPMREQVWVCVCMFLRVFLLTAVPSCEAEMTYYPESVSGHGSKRIHAYRRRLHRREAKFKSNQGPSVWVLDRKTSQICLCTARFSSCFVWLPLNGSHYQPHATTYHM